MTTNKPKVVVYRYTASRSFGKRNRKWHYQESFPHASNREVAEIGQMEELIRLSDYQRLQADHERLQAEVDKLRNLPRHAQPTEQKPAPNEQMEVVGWQFYEDGKWWNGDDRIKDHRKNTQEAGFRIRDVYAITGQS